MKTVYVTLLISIMMLGFTMNTYAGINDGLVAYYPFNGNADDASGNGLHGNVVNATLSSDKLGNSNCAYLFNGSNSHIDIEDNSAFYPASITACAWVKYNSLNYARNYICSTSADSDDPPYDPFRLYIDNEGYLNAVFESQNDLNRCWLKSTDQLFSGVWYFIAAYFDSNTQKAGIYVNNTQISATAPFTSLGTSTRGFCIGAGYNSQYGVHDYFDGIIDEVRIYDRALNISEIKELSGSFGNLAMPWIPLLLLQDDQNVRIELFRDPDCTQVLDDWPASANQLWSPKHILGKEDNIYVRVKGPAGKGNSSYFVSVKRESDLDVVTQYLEETSPGVYVYNRDLRLADDVESHQ